VHVFGKKNLIITCVGKKGRLLIARKMLPRNKPQTTTLKMLSVFGSCCKVLNVGASMMKTFLD
jgi:hypothetical protein